MDKWFTIDQIDEGTYIIRKNRVNRKHGSVQDKWMGLNMESGLTIKELEYLEKSSISEITLTEQTACGGSLFPERPILFLCPEREQLIKMGQVIGRV